MSFVKLYGSIIHSSIWSEPDHVRIVWLTMLAMSTYQGVVEASVGGIAHAARVSLANAKEALERLQAPDPDSRDGSTGERIRKVDGGWEIINHNRYRDMRSPRQVKQAEYQRRYRERHEDAHGEQSEKSEHHVMLTPSLSPSPSPSTSQSPSPQKPERKKKTDAIEEALGSPEFQRFWSAYDLKKGRDEAAKSWGKIAPDQHLAETIITAARWYAEDNPDKAFRKHPATWLNQKGWLDERVSKGGTNAKPQDGGFDRFNNWKGVPRGKVDYSVGLGEDDPEHPKQLLANENGIRASRSLPPLTMDEWVAMGDPRARQGT